jgi:hypothetical protein
VASPAAREQDKPYCHCSANSIVLRRSAYITRNRQPRSRTHLTCAEPRCADLESVLVRVMTPRYESGRSAVISDGNRDGNDDNHRRPDATVNSHVLPARPA